jgi:predicted Rossmann fold flavoprotein
MVQFALYQDWMMTQTIAVIGAGAAGLMAAICAGRNNTQRDTQIVVLDGAAKLGAKILVAGGGRCNVTHESVSAEDYAGSSRYAIRKVLRSFDVPQTVAFFREIGVEFKQEATGKLFPVTDSARTVLNALVNAAQEAGAELRYPCRVETVQKTDSGFIVNGAWGALHADRVMLATGGRSLPKSGSDGGGYRLAQALGHSLTEYIFPALVPLTLPADHFLCALSGVSIHGVLTVQDGSKRPTQFTNSILFTHFGLSGPGALDISRYYTDARRNNPAVRLLLNFFPDHNMETVDIELTRISKATVQKWLMGTLPERLARALCDQAGINGGMTGDRLPRERRRTLASLLTALPLPITGDRGYNYAEVTAGGVPLSELHLDTMESRLCPGLYLCGEICDVDGRIGGFNFQWAWASGALAGRAAVS